MKFLRRKLKNGMTVIMEKRELPVVSLSISNRFGAAAENSKIKGIAHFIEHLVFTGTKTRNHEDITREIEKKGGMVNAFTSNEMTSFLFKLPSEHVFAGLDILSDILENPVFEEKKFEKEKKVILEEIKMYHDNPAHYVHELIQEALYESPFGDGIAGSEKTVSSLQRDFVYDYYNQMYSPENYIVTIVGSADFDKICDYLEKNFKKRGKKSPSYKIQKRNLHKKEERAGIDQAHYIFALHAPVYGSREYYAFEVLDAYMANGMSSRLFLKIREERGLAYSVRGDLQSEKNYSYYTIYVGTTKKAISEVQNIILDEFENVKNMSEKDLKEAKERIIGLRKIKSEESSNVMNELAFSELITKAEDYYDHDKNIMAVTLEDVKKAAKFSKYSTAVVVPK